MTNGAVDPAFYAGDADEFFVPPDDLWTALPVPAPRTQPWFTRDTPDGDARSEPRVGQHRLRTVDPDPEPDPDPDPDDVTHVEEEIAWGEPEFEVSPWAEPAEDHAPEPEPREAPAPRTPRPGNPWAAHAAPPGRRSASHRTGGPARISDDTVVRAQDVLPESGWRRALWELSGGRFHPGVGSAARARDELVRRIRTPLRGSHRIAVISVKGGVGKTTVSACLGLTFAELRGDRVLTMDANPDMGTLADRLTGDTSVTVQHLLDHLGGGPVTSINDIEQFVSTTGRLQVLAGGQEPCDGQAFTRDEYEEAIDALSRCYNIVITDSGTGVNHSAMEGTIAAADAVVIIGAPTVDAASRASMTLDWLDGIGHGELARQAVVALSLDRGSREVDGDLIRDHFTPRCRAVVEIPADPHLATGGRIDLERCRPGTREAFQVLAAELADAFPRRARAARPAR